MEKRSIGFNVIRIIRTVLFKRPQKGWLKQVRMQRAIDRRGKVRQVIIGLFMCHQDFMDAELIVNPKKGGVSIIIPKKCPWSTFQLKRVYKKPCGSLEVQFEYKQKRIYRRERPLKPHQALLGRRCE